MLFLVVRRENVSQRRKAMFAIRSRSSGSRGTTGQPLRAAASMAHTKRSRAGFLVVRSQVGRLCPAILARSKHANLPIKWGLPLF